MAAEKGEKARQACINKYSKIAVKARIEEVLDRVIDKSIMV